MTTSDIPEFALLCESRVNFGMQALFFERPFLLIGALIVAQFVVTWTWARSRTPRTRGAALVGVLLFPLLLGVQALVVTDRERITAICAEMADAMDAGDIARLGAHVAPTFAVGEMGRAELLTLLEQTLTRVKVEEPRLSDFEVTADGDTAAAEFAASCCVVTPNAIETGLISRWALRFQQIGGRWQVVEIKPVPTPWFPSRTLNEVLRASGG